MSAHLSDVRSLLKSANARQGILPQQLPVVGEECDYLPGAEGPDHRASCSSRAGTPKQTGDFRKPRIAPEELSILCIDRRQHILGIGGIDPAVVIGRPTA